MSVNTESTRQPTPTQGGSGTKPPPTNGANGRQVGGDHYKVGGEEHWDRVARLGLDYFQACITKYVERWRKKGGIQDLLKAKHFLEKYIELEQSKGKEAGVTHGPQLLRMNEGKTEGIVQDVSPLAYSLEESRPDELDNLR